MFISISWAVTNKCQIKEGIVFAYHNKWNGKESNINEGIEVKQKVSELELYAEQKMRGLEYRRIKISLERVNRILVMVENSWLNASRQHALKELENILDRQHELEKATEGIEDVFLREYIYEQLDMIATTRRNMSEEIRWDVEANKVS